MSKDSLLSVLYFLLAALFAFGPAIGTLSAQLLWLAALIFVGLGIVHLSKAVKK